MKVAWCMVLTWMILSNLAYGYFEESQLSLPELALNSDLIVKATVLSDVPANERWLSGKPSFADMESRMRVISVIDPGEERPATYYTGRIGPPPPKNYGVKPGDVIRFEHFDFDLGEMASMVDIQCDHLEKDRTYIVFMRHMPGAPSGIFTQVYFYPHRYKQGVLRCANEAPVKAFGINVVFRMELEALAGSRKPGDPGYAAQQVDHLSSRSPDGEGYTPATVPQWGAKGFSWFGLNGEYRMQGATDLSRNDAERIMERLYFNAPTAMADPDPHRRASLARAAAFSGLDEYGPVLASLLSDHEEFVCTAAAVALLSYPSGSSEVEAAMFAHRHDKDVGPFFVVRLHTKAVSADEVADLVDVVKQANLPVKWAGLNWPPAQAMTILWEFMHRQSDADLRAGKFDSELAALAHFPPADVAHFPETALPQQYVYAFYLARGMVDEAKKFRAAMDLEHGADFDANFAKVDEDPGNIRYVWYALD